MATAVKESYLDSNKDKSSNTTNGFLSFFRLFFLDFLLLNFSFFICYFFKTRDLELSGAYAKLLFMFYLCWFVTSVMANKFKPSSYTAYGGGIQVFFKSSLYMTYAIVFWVVVSEAGYSRVHVFSTCLMVFVLEILAWSMYNINVSSKDVDRIKLENIVEQFRLENHISWFLVFMDLFLLVSAFFMVNYLKRDQLVLLPDYSKLFVLYLGVWFLVSAMTKKFSISSFKSVYFFTWQWIKAGFLMLAAMSILIFGLRLFEYSRFQSLGAILMLLVMEIIMISFYYRISQGKERVQDIESADKAKNVLKQEDIQLDINIDFIRQKLNEPAREKFRHRVGSDNPELFEFMDQHIDLDDMLRMETSIERSCELFDPDTDRLPARLLLNRWKINDIRRVNEYFLSVHKMLLPGGFYIGYAHTIKTHYEWMYKKYPKYFAHLLYMISFGFLRIMPKLPGLQKIYFSVTKGRGRMISRAEVLGRLSFCGFEIVAEKEINQRLYVIAKKIKTSSLDQSPTYGPLVELKRSGFGGEVLYIHKFRTMHPYSEYLQQYVYDLNGLQKGGKVEQDFRMTTWGRYMRKFWLDELPMLYNWIKGDLQLVGVRPLSFHYLSLYDKDLRELRKKVKPGLIPPFYADLPGTFKEICDSERKYIHAFLKNPIRTQFIYFWKSFVNIAFKGARSN